MKFKIIAVICISLVSISAYYFYPRTISDGKVKVKCTYMAYACGDCYPQYRVREILEGQTDDVKKILNTEIAVEFKNNLLANELDKNTAKCAICYYYYFTGELKKSKKKGVYFLAENVTYELKNNSCCKE